MPSKRIKRKSYPYPILRALAPDPEQHYKLHPSNVVEFFRIEALLRSDEVMELYRTRMTNSGVSPAIITAYGFDWHVLRGTHHRYLHPESQCVKGASLGRSVGPGVTDISGWLGGDEVSGVPSPFCLYLEIDTTIPPKKILDVLKPLLHERHEQSGDSSPRIDVHVWLGYFQCYDHFVCDAWSYGQIGRHVYPEKDQEHATDLAKKAVAGVDDLIQSAVQKQWPPCSL